MKTNLHNGIQLVLPTLMYLLNIRENFLDNNCPVSIFQMKTALNELLNDICSVKAQRAKNFNIAVVYNIA